MPAAAFARACLRARTVRVPPYLRCPRRQRLSLWQLGYQLLKFGLRPSACGAGPHVPLRAEGECEFRDVVSIRSINNGQQIGVAGCEVDLLDFDSHFFGEVARGLRA